MNITLLCVILVSLANYSLSARILAVLPFTTMSHIMFNSAILRALLQQGHQIVQYSPFPLSSDELPNYTHVKIQTRFEERKNNRTYEDFAKIFVRDNPKIGFRCGIVWEMTYEICEDTFKNKEIQGLLTSDDHFDLVITESTFGQESMLVFGHKFGAPTITLQAFSIWSGLNRDAGNSLSIASIPDGSYIVTTDQMTFTERVWNFLSVLVTLNAYYNHHLPLQEKIIRENYIQNVPPLVDIVNNVSLYLVNAHPTLEYQQPYTSNIIPIAGITISSDRMLLPQNIQNFMDEAKEGVIYFSLGTVILDHLLPKEVLHIFVNVFKKIHHKVLWKTKSERLPGLSDNVMLTTWVPQPGVLAHPNCVLFMTHGGLFSQQEAIHAGVPTVGIPFFGDQPYNIKFNEHSGVGVELVFKTLSEENVISALNIVLNDPKFKKNAQQLSQIFKDQPLSPTDSAVFWVEYVLRHSGAHHLRPAAAKLSWYQLALLDILLFILLAIVTLSFIVYLIFTKVLSLMFCWKEQYCVTNNKKKS